MRARKAALRRPTRIAALLGLLLVVGAIGLPAAATADAGSAVINQCVQTGAVSSSYSAAAYVEALRELTPDVLAYTDCQQLILQAQRARLRALPPPVLYMSADASVVSGQVFIKLGKGRGFVPLIQGRAIPIGALLDTTRGIVRLTTASPVKGQHFTATVTGGMFTLFQRRRQKGLTELDLHDRRPRAVCAALGKKASSAKALGSATLGLLKSTDHGRFSTRGAYSSASARGTAYSVQDTCAGTLTRVTRGSVLVDYFRRHTLIIVKAGQSFLAKFSGRTSRVVTVGKGSTLASKKSVRTTTALDIGGPLRFLVSFEAHASQVGTAALDGDTRHVQLFAMGGRRVSGRVLCGPRRMKVTAVLARASLTNRDHARNINRGMLEQGLRLLDSSCPGYAQFCIVGRGPDIASR